MKDERIVVLVGRFDICLLCYKEDDIIYVRGVRNLEEIRNYFDIDNSSQNVLLRAYNLFEDIVQIVKDYEHNN